MSKKNRGFAFAAIFMSMLVYTAYAEEADRVTSEAIAEGFSLVGRLSATDQEADEGYFAIDQQTMIVVKPGSELHAYLRGQAGKHVRITVEPAADSANSENTKE